MVSLLDRLWQVPFPAFSPLCYDSYISYPQIITERSLHMQALFNENYSLSDFNNELLQQTADDVVNEIQLLLASDTSKLSVVINPLEEETDYHGIHPVFDQEFLFQFITNHTLKSASDFWKGVDALLEANQQDPYKLVNLIHFQEKASLANLGYSQTAYERVLLGQCILQTASHFGFKFQTNHSDFSKLKQVLDETIKNQPALSAMAQFDDKSKTITLMGLWPENVLNQLDQELILIQTSNKNWQLSLKNNSQQATTSLTDFYFKSGNRYDFYSNHFQLAGSAVYYSGVMPSVAKLQLDNEQVESRVKYLTLDVFRTTFATLDTMDNPLMTQHPFFDSDNREIIDDFYAHEDKVQETYLHQRSSHNDQDQTEAFNIDKINNYLKRSFNSHTLAVSGNIVTSDDYLIVSQRNPSSIDGGEYYCSANGQSEFRDPNVAYYKKSVFEDLPTLDFHSDFRVDLNGEMTREAIAELGIAQYHNEWNYYGISYLNINNDHKSQIHRRRMHFNVLMKNQAVKNFEEIDKYIGDVTEDFENASVEGVRNNLFYNLVDRSLNGLNNLINFAYDHSGLIALTIVFLFSFINLFVTIPSAFTPAFDLEISFILDLIISVSFIIFSIIGYFRRRPFRQKIDTISIDVDDIDKQMDRNAYIAWLMKKFSRKSNRKAHAIFVLMYSLYILDLKREYSENK